MDWSDVQIKHPAKAMEAAASRILGRNYHPKKAAPGIWDTLPSSDKGEELVRGMFDILAKIWPNAVGHRAPSDENWRWKPQQNLAPHNDSSEVRLERKFIQECERRGRKDWSNQVPVMSGLVSSGDRHRAIDLVYKRAEGAFDLIELKFESNNAIYAAVEIVQYGLIWLLSRNIKNYADKKLIKADDIHLAVLAPAKFYCDLNWSWFAKGIDTALAAIGQNMSVKIGFSFEEFPDEFTWSGKGELPDDLCHFFDNRKKR